MIAAWMVYAIAVAAALGAGAAALEPVAVRGRVPMRWLWCAALLASLTIPALALRRPASTTGTRPAVVASIPAPIPGTGARGAKRLAGPTLAPAGADQRAQVGGAVAALPAAPTAVRTWTAGAGAQARTAVAAVTRALGWADPFLAAFWLVASVLLLLRLIAGHRRLSAARSAWSRADVGGRAVLVSRQVGPAVVGLLRGRIVLPGWTLALERSFQELVVLHESEHLRAGDPQLVGFASAVCVLFPWNLALWWQIRRLRLAVEIDCDARVLRRRPNIAEYGALLLDIGRLGSRLREPFVLSFFQSSRTLERRIDVMTSLVERIRWSRVAATAAAGLVAIVAACNLPAPEARPILRAERGGPAESVTRISSVPSPVPRSTDAQPGLVLPATGAESATKDPSNAPLNQEPAQAGVTAPPPFTVEIYHAPTDAATSGVSAQQPVVPSCVRQERGYRAGFSVMYRRPSSLYIDTTQPGVLSGRVRDGCTEEPVSGMRVSVAPALAGGAAVTDSAGSFVLSVGAAGLHEIGFSHPAYGDTAFAFPFFTDTTNAFFSFSRIPDSSFVQPPPPQAQSPTVRGQVLDYNTNEPIDTANVTITTGTDTIYARTAPNGVFLAQLTGPGAYRFRVSRGGYLPTTTPELAVPRGEMAMVVRIALTPDSSARSAAQPAPPAPRQIGFLNRVAPTTQGQPGLPVCDSSRTVVLSSYRPIAAVAGVYTLRASFQLVDPAARDSALAARRDAALQAQIDIARAALRLPYSTVPTKVNWTRVMLTHPGHRLELAPPERDTSLDRATPGVVTGTVIDSSSGFAIAGMSVELKRDGVPFIARTMTDCAGRFRVDTPDYNEYRLSFQGDGYYGILTSPIEFMPGMRTEAEVRFWPADPRALPPGR